MGYIKSRVNGTVQGMYCDICGKEYVRVVSNPNNSSQDMCVKCYNDFYNGGQQKDQQIAELKAENERLCVKYNVYTYGDKIERDKIYAVSGEALEFLINNQNEKAIEQLEKVKWILIQNADEIGEEYKEDYFMISLGNVKNIIDQQINKLKGKVEDE